MSLLRFAYDADITSLPSAASARASFPRRGPVLTHHQTPRLRTEQALSEDACFPPCPRGPVTAYGSGRGWSLLGRHTVGKVELGLYGVPPVEDTEFGAVAGLEDRAWEVPQDFGDAVEHT